MGTSPSREGSELDFLSGVCDTPAIWQHFEIRSRRVDNLDSKTRTGDHAEALRDNGFVALYRWNSHLQSGHTLGIPMPKVDKQALLVRWSEVFIVLLEVLE